MADLDLDALKSQHGTIAVVEFDEGEVVVFKRPSRAAYDCFVDSNRKQSDLRRLESDCLVHPAKDEFLAILDRYPFATAGACADAVIGLAGLGKAKLKTM